MSRDWIHDAKCTASMTPPEIIRRVSFLPHSFHMLFREIRHHAMSIHEAILSRHAAIDKEGAPPFCASFMNVDAVDTANTPVKRPRKGAFEFAILDFRFAIEKP
jgi:hypothetical protein